MGESKHNTLLWCKVSQGRQHASALYLNTLERFHIHKEAASHSRLNDEHTITPNQIFDTILNIDP